MNVYNDILNEINMILAEDDVEFDNEKISLYDLYNALNLHFEDLRKFYSGKNLFIHNEPFHIKAYKKVIVTIKKECIELYIYFQDFLTDGFKIIKERENDNVYIEKLGAPEKKINTFMKKHYDEIMQVFEMLEKYQEEKDYDVGSITYGNYKFTLFLVYKGDIILNIAFEDNSNNLNNKKEVFEREYYGKEKLSDLVKNYKLEISKKVPIAIDTLPPAIRNIVEKQDKKVKTKGHGVVVK